MDLEDYLDYGLDVNEDDNLDRLLTSLQALPDDADKRTLLKAAQNRKQKLIKSHLPPMRDQLMLLARLWYSLDSNPKEPKNRTAYKELLRDSSSLKNNLANAKPKVQQFHAALTQFAHSDDPKRVTEALFLVHELAVYLRRYKTWDDWPKKDSPAPTAWEFSQQ